MPLTSGSRLGSYEVVAPLGEGGMGEVYRARDTKLGRQVAIKILLDAVAADRERIARFEREARMLAALNHPHIAALYGMDEADGRHFLVMELVEGETLAERLIRGAIRVEESLALARQIVDALEAAHERGIVHRDLKPANVKVAPDGRVKVLDFGLAKAMSDESAVGAAAGATHSPTLSMMATQAGIILGTAAYMSPEQAKGLPADHRSDVFSFGCVLYEMLTRRQPFHGETTPDVLASVLVREPDFTSLPPNLSPRIHELLKRCLEKDPRRRWQATGDLRAEIETVAATPFATATTHFAAQQRPLWKRVLPVAAAVVVASGVTAAAMWTLRPTVPAPLISRFSITPGSTRPVSNITRNSIAISPDGTQIAYAVLNELYVRPLAEFAERRVTTFGGPGLGMPVFSPDGRSIAVYTQEDNSIKRVPVAGGPATNLVQTFSPYGMSWDESGVLYVDPTAGIKRVSGNGGKPELLAPQRQSDELLFGPDMLPDGEHVLFTQSPRLSTSSDTAAIVVESIKTHERTRLIEGASDGRFVPTGHIVYAAGGVLFAVPFDLKRLAVTGAPVPVVEGVRRSSSATTPTAFYSASRNGTLVYVPGPASLAPGGMDVGLIDRNGMAEPLRLPPAPYEFPRVSPDGKRLAVHTDDGKGANVWVYELSGGTALRRLTNTGRNRFPVWSEDSRRVAFQSNREGDAGIFWQPADGSGTAERLTKAEKDVEHVPESWSPDGKYLLFAKVTTGQNSTLWTLSTKDGATTKFGAVEVASGLPAAAYSPDGRFVAYSVGGTGIFIQPFPATGAAILVGQGIHPFWTTDGKALLYRRRGQTFSVSVTTKPAFTFGKPVLVNFGAYRQRGPTVEREIDPTRDGKFAAVIAGGATETDSQPRIHVVVNWFEELKQRVPIAK